MATHRTLRRQHFYSEIGPDMVLIGQRDDMISAGEPVDIATQKGGRVLVMRASDPHWSWFYADSIERIEQQPSLFGGE